MHFVEYDNTFFEDSYKKIHNPELVRIADIYAIKYSIYFLFFPYQNLYSGPSFFKYGFKNFFESVNSGSPAA